MSVDDPTAGFEERLRQLIELRKIEEEKYGELLTRLDQIWQVDLPQEAKPKIPEIKENLNHSWDISRKFLSVLETEDRPFWKEVARSFREYIEPVVRQQREVNSLVVHLLNEYSEAVQHSLDQIQTFHYTLIHYFQRVIPVIDTKFREMAGSAENFQIGLREYSDLIFQQLDKKILTLQTDFDSLKSLQTSVQSLHHLANALEDKSETVTPPGISRMERHSRHFQALFDGETAEYFFPLVEQFKNVQKAVAFCASHPILSDFCKKLGMDVISELSFASIPVNSLGGIFCAGELERLLPEEVLNFLRTAHTKLKAGGQLVLAAVNAGSVAGFFENFLTDPGHLTPWHPLTLKFLTSATGFQNPQIVFVNPVRAPHQLQLISSPESEKERSINENFEKLNRLLYEPRHYALIAQK